jgi:hypothetical protein
MYIRVSQGKEYPSSRYWFKHMKDIDDKVKALPRYVINSATNMYQMLFTRDNKKLELTRMYITKDEFGILAEDRLLTLVNGVTLQLPRDIHPSILSKTYALSIILDLKDKTKVTYRLYYK